MKEEKVEEGKKQMETEDRRKRRGVKKGVGVEGVEEEEDGCGGHREREAVGGRGGGKIEEEVK